MNSNGNLNFKFLELLKTNDSTVLEERKQMKMGKIGIVNPTNSAYKSQNIKFKKVEIFSPILLYKIARNFRIRHFSSNVQN